jgi:hypothetical protein
MLRSRGLLAIAVMLMQISAAAAQSPADFYRGKTLSMIFC